MCPDRGRFNVLISSAGRRVALMESFRHTLGTLGLSGRVLAADSSSLSAAFHAADGAYLVPRCTEEDFIPTMLDICRREGVRLVVPTIDPELPVYAEHRCRFAEAGVTVAVSSPAVVAIGADKVAAHAWLVGHGFPTVSQAGVAEVLAAPGTWPFPLLVKPRFGSSARGVAVVGDTTELRVATRAGDFLVQTIATGVEYSVDLLVDGRGRCRCVVPRRRLEVRAGEVSKGITVRLDCLEDLAFRIGNALPGAYGALTLQVFVGPDERLSVIELNPRFGGGYPLAWRSMADFPRWMIEEILGLPSTASQDEWRSGLVMLRYDEAVFVDAVEVGM